ncbi:putative DNA primase small subunit [Rhizophagus irregularis]|nr:putative DNA primase small subunit [Rhizophagus irregularis]
MANFLGESYMDIDDPEVHEDNDVDMIIESSSNKEDDKERNFWKGSTNAKPDKFEIEEGSLELLRVFYKRFFPYKTYCYWLNYSIDPMDKPFQNREFNFVKPGDDEVYMRYLSFDTIEEFKNEVLRVCPKKIDIGAVFTAKPKEKKSLKLSALKPVEKELIFDIDMNDYDEFRTCCSGATICEKCWQLIAVAIKILDSALREDFGFKYLLWVYSGRRGVHCWVCDERARKLSDDERKSIASYLGVIKGGAQQNKKVHLYKNSLHPSLTRAHKIIEEYFERVILEDQEVLKDEREWTKVLECIPDDGVRRRLDDDWRKNSSRHSTEKWDNLLAELESSTKMTKNQKKADSLRVCKIEIMLQYLYPRLDEAVSTKMIHLLKSPFCVHPSTGRVCVPIIPEECENFNPMVVPTISSLYNEINDDDRSHVKNDGERSLHDYEKTSLSPYIKYFDKFVQSILKETLAKNKAAMQMSMEF